MLELFYNRVSTQGEGFGYAFALVACAIIASLLEHRGLYLSGRMKVQTVNGLRGLIFRKALRLREFQVPQSSVTKSGGSQSLVGLSQWVSIVSTDIPAVGEYLNVFCPLWLGIIETIVCVGLMAYIVDYAVFAGVLIVGLLVFVANALAVATGDKAKAIGGAGGQRTQLLGQLLSVIRAVKFYAWEKAFLDKLKGKRTAEESHLHDFHFYKTVSFVVAVIAPIFLGVVVMLVFSSYRFITLSTAFPALVLLGILRNVLWNVPVYLSAYLDAMVAAKRIRVFLEAPEVGPWTSAVIASSISSSVAQEAVRVDHQQKSRFQRINVDPSLPSGTIAVRSGHFSWSQHAPAAPVASSSDTGYFALNDIDLMCVPGSLTAVVGSVGSGNCVFDAVFDWMSVRSM